MEVKRKSNKVVAQRKATKQVVETKKPLWVKKTGGFLRLQNGGRRVKPNEKIYATRAELGRYLNQFELLRDVASDREEFAKDESKRVKAEEKLGGEGPFAPKHIGGGYYNVLSVDGKQMNEDKIQGKAAVEAFIKELGGSE